MCVPSSLKQELESKSPLLKADSTTEKSEEDDAVGPLAPPAISTQSQAILSRPLVSPRSLSGDLNTGGDMRSKSPLARTSDRTPALTATSKQSDLDDSSSLAKKPQASSSDSDSEAERRARIARLKGNARESGTREGITNRSVRQPIKRGGKRF